MGYEARVAHVARLAPREGPEYPKAGDSIPPAELSQRFVIELHADISSCRFNVQYSDQRVSLRGKAHVALAGKSAHRFGMFSESGGGGAESVVDTSVSAAARRESGF